MTEEKPVYDVNTAREALAADEQARIDEFNTILARESARLRVTVIAVVEKIALGNGVFADRAEARVVAER